ncbi:hypothetical protein CYY_007191 [Polysphondylium violaceum]|uniref:C2 domain-containing protein n=1 Tax=Polysphondylium violaceum TaxID=133409 RepID=A0A8J4PR55_9MYCE|nr:hypothetical protein CYY_007191 [Polysphondylium violaceum]
MNQQQQQQQQQYTGDDRYTVSSPSRIVSSPSLSSPHSNSVPNGGEPIDIPVISLFKTPLVKNKVEIDFSARASKEGLFSMWTSTSEKKIQYSVKDLTIVIDPPPISSVNLNNSSSGNNSSNSNLSKSMVTSPSIASATRQQQYSKEELASLFEMVHYCIFFSTQSTLKRDVINSMNQFFYHMIRENASNVKVILGTMFEVFGYYLDIARKEEENDDTKKFTVLIGSLERFTQETLNSLKDASEFSLVHLQKQFTTHLTEQVKKTLGSGNNQSSTNIFNDSLQKFNYILSVAVESVEAYQKSQIIKNALKLDTYLEKTLYLKSKALSSKEFYLCQLKCRKINIDSHPYYSRDTFVKEDGFKSWRKAEESTLARLSQQTLPREEYLKSIWGIKTKDKEPIGVIAIKVCRGRDLIQKEDGKPEAFIEIAFGHEKKRTKKVTGVNPVWKEHFNFQITKANLNETLELSIWDSRNTKSNEKIHFLGKFELSTKELLNYTKREVNWFPLQKRTSRSRISGDIRLQFHYLQYPEPNQFPNPIVYYRVLLDKLIESEMKTSGSPNENKDINSSNSSNNSNNNSNNNNLQPPTITSPILTKKKFTNNTDNTNSFLSQASTSLLKEFCERFGIMEHTSKLFLMIKLINITIKYLSLEFIPEIRSILKLILEIKFGDIGLTVEEDTMLRESVNMLAMACKIWISYFHSIFPQNSPPGSLRMLIDIYYLLRSSELSPSLIPLPELMKETYVNRYQQALMMATDLSKKSNPPLGRAAILVRICDILLFNIDIDQRLFSRDFPSDSNILIISLQVYTDSITQEIDELTELGANNPTELSEFLELYFKLKETMSKFKDINPKLVLVPIPVLFKQCVLQWTLHSADQLKNLIDKLCANETWTPISQDTLHSASIGEVILGCYHALDVIKSLRWEDLQKDHQNGEHSLFEIFSNFTMVVSESIIYYTNVIRDISLNALDQAADDIFQLSESYSNSLIQTIQKVSLRFNNIQACLGHTEDLISVLLRIMASYRLSSSIVNQMATHTYAAINNNVRTLIDRIYNRLAPVIIGEIYGLVGIDLDKSKNIVVDFFKNIEKNFDQLTIGNNNIPIQELLEPLLSYIASKLQIFSQYLYYPLTKQLLKRLWAGIINIIDEMIFPQSGKKLHLSANQIDMIEGMIKTFGEFFYVDGEGLTQKAIDKQSERFMVILLAYREAINSGVRDFDPLGLKNALKNLNLSNLKPDLTYLKKLNINLKGIPKQLDIFSLIKNSVEKRQKERKEREQKMRPSKKNNHILTSKLNSFKPSSNNDREKI